MTRINPAIVSIMHPTDFSDLSANAFVHALRISVAVKCKLYIVHVAEQADEEWLAFPHVRQTLARWGLFDERDSTAAIYEKLGVEVAKVEVEPQDPVRGFLRFHAGHRSELIVLATHGRDGLPRWLEPSLAEAMSRRAATQTLFISAHGRGFVDSASGEFDLKRVLVPVDHNPPPATAIRAIRRFCHAVGAAPKFYFVHVGAQAPELETEETDAGAEAADVELRSGEAVDGILQAAADIEANLIGMATAGHHGLLDAIRGSTTERVLRQAACPVLAVPVR